MKTRATRFPATGLPVILTAVLMSGAAQAANPDKTGYVVDSDGEVVRNSTGLCVHTREWKPELAIPGCDGYTVSKAEPEPMPEVAPAEIAPAASKPMPSQVFTLETETYFGFDNATLRPEAYEELNRIAEKLSADTTIRSVTVAGHADRIGPEDYNQQLSQARAQAVRDYLQQKIGFEEDKLEVVGKGESMPKVSCEGMRGNALIECLQPNRRVEVEVYAKGTAPGGATSGGATTGGQQDLYQTREPR